MCLGVPGQVMTIDHNELGITTGQVAFGGITRQVFLAWVPEVEVGDYVVVHVGFAISRIDAHEAQRVFRTLKDLGELQDLELPATDAGAGDT